MIKMFGFPPPVSKTYYNWESGLRIHGDEYIQVESLTDPRLDDADCFYQTNELKPKFFHEHRADQHGNFMQYIIDSKKPYIVSESAPFRKHPEWMRFGWWSYKWDLGNFNNSNAGPERWNKFERESGVKFTDWHQGGDDIIIMGQKEGDSSLRRIYESGYESFYFWVVDVIKEIRQYSDRKIIIRPHPRNLQRGIRYTTKALKQLKKHEGISIKNIELSDNLTEGGNQGGMGLETDLQRAHCVITYNSLSGVEAVQAGIPVFALDGGSMVHPVAHHDLSEIEDLRYDIDLQDWKNKIAYTMWNKEEVQTGECWEHLKQVYFK